MHTLRVKLSHHQKHITQHSLPFWWWQYMSQSMNKILRLLEEDNHMSQLILIYVFFIFLSKENKNKEVFFYFHFWVWDPPDLVSLLLLVSLPLWKLFFQFYSFSPISLSQNILTPYFFKTFLPLILSLHIPPNTLSPHFLLLWHHQK